MYTVLTKDMSKLSILDKTKLNNLDGFIMTSKKKSFQIKGSTVTKIKIVNKKLAYPLVIKKVSKRYVKLINLLTELLLDDDEEGTSCREALNQIEKFRLEIKIKYRKFLKKKELEQMSKQLLVLQKEATNRLIEISNSYMEYKQSNNHK